MHIWNLSSSKLLTFCYGLCGLCIRGPAWPGKSTVNVFQCFKRCQPGGRLTGHCCPVTCVMTGILSACQCSYRVVLWVLLFFPYELQMLGAIVRSNSRHLARAFRSLSQVVTWRAGEEPLLWGRRSQVLGIRVWETGTGY